MSKAKYKRITIKVGTRVLTGADNRIDRGIIRKLSDQIALLMDRGIEVVLVTSGAIGSGLGLLNIDRRNRSLSELQAIASIGQNHLMDIYSECFNKKGYVAGQILLTQEDFNSRKRFLNIRYTINTLLSFKAVPVINENDSVSTDEIKCGDNDRLSSLVADAVNADLLIILTDVEGLYDDSGTLVPFVETVDKGITSLCKGKGSVVSTGGMRTKLEAVKNASSAGIECVIARGKTENIILDAVDGKGVGTRFAADKKTIKARKRWIAFSVKPKGRIIIDDGAENAIVHKNKSLLPSGVCDVSGRFKEGDIVEITNTGKEIIARGMTNYAADEIARIKGKRSDEIEETLGHKDYDEIVHRDNLVVTGDSRQKREK